jgi:hypothetical protein
VSSLLLIVAAGIETSIYQPGKVHCKYCKGRSGNPWFLAKNVPGHLACASHLKSAKEEQVRRETREQLDHLPTQDHKRFRQTGFQYVQLSHPRQPEVLVTCSCSCQAGNAHKHLLVRPTSPLHPLLPFATFFVTFFVTFHSTLPHGLASISVRNHTNYAYVPTHPIYRS